MRCHLCQRSGHLVRVGELYFCRDSLWCHYWARQRLGISKGMARGLLEAERKAITV